MPVIPELREAENPAYTNESHGSREARVPGSRVSQAPE